MKTWTLAAVLALVVVPVPAFAQKAQSMVAASDPASLRSALLDAGYEAELTTDSYGDPKIETEFGGWEGSVVFYNCDETAHDQCQSVAFSVGFDRATPMLPEMANAIVRKQRYFAMHLDDEGDPFMTWDIVTAGGIPTSVFMRSVRMFSEQVDVVSELVFADERSNGDGEVEPTGAPLS